MTSRHSYNEKVTIYSESGDLLGIGILDGRAQKSSRSGRWGWEANLFDTDFEPGILMESGQLRVEFDDGAEGQALCRSVRYHNAVPSVRLQGTGTPPRVSL